MLETYPTLPLEPVLSFSPSARLSYAEMMASACQLAGLMQEIELPQRFVMLFADPRENLITTYAALLTQRTAIQQTLVSSAAAGISLAALMQNAGIEAVLTTPDYLTTLSSHAPALCDERTLYTVCPLDLN